MLIWLSENVQRAELFAERYGFAGAQSRTFWSAKGCSKSGTSQVRPWGWEAHGSSTATAIFHREQCHAIGSGNSPWRPWSVAGPLERGPPKRVRSRALPEKLASHSFQHLTPTKAADGLSTVTSLVTGLKLAGWAGSRAVLPAIARRSKANGARGMDTRFRPTTTSATRCTSAVQQQGLKWMDFCYTYQYVSMLHVPNVHVLSCHHVDRRTSKGSEVSGSPQGNW